MHLSSSQNRWESEKMLKNDWDIVSQSYPPKQPFNFVKFVPKLWNLKKLRYIEGKMSSPVKDWNVPQ